MNSMFEEDAFKSVNFPFSQAKLHGFQFNLRIARLYPHFRGSL